MAIRIISGDLKGKKLKSVPGLTTRPTTDRVRESLFNILSSRVEKAIVLDLFAGTGAFGIEALSRGASTAVFIDENKTAYVTIKKNIESCAMGARSKTIKWNILKNLNCIKNATPSFDLVFMDPPYNQNLVQKTLILLQTSNCLANRALVIVEHTPKEPITLDVLNFDNPDQRKYGNTLISFLTFKTKDG